MTSGCDTIDTCEASTSVIVAPARSAILRCAAGGMILSSVPITAISSIVEDSNAPLVLGTDYEFEAKSGLLWRLTTAGTRINWTGLTTTVTYSAGYVLPMDAGTRTLPYEIEDATLSMIHALYFLRGADPSVVLEVVEGVGRTGYNKNPSFSATASASFLSSRLLASSCERWVSKRARFSSVARNAFFCGNR